MPPAFSSPKKVSKRGIKGDGRPSKLTPTVMAKLKEAFSYGLNDDQAAAVAGVSDVTRTIWKRNPAFMAELRGAINERLLVRLKRIEAGDNGWQGCGWILERLLPRQWAKPEVLVAIQNTMNVNNGAQNLEALVLSDLQFSELRKNPNYEHRKPAVEVEASIRRVPDDVAGTLVRADCPRNAIVSQSQEEENQRRLRDVDAKIAKLFAAKGKAKNGNGVPAIPTPEASSGALVPALITMPEGEPGSGWWRQLTTGSGEREIERATAEKVCRLIVGDVFGRLKAQQTPISFDPSTPILLRDVHQAIDDLCGAEGWKALVRRGK
jgi:hypothetical protein